MGATERGPENTVEDSTEESIEEPIEKSTETPMEESLKEVEEEYVEKPIEELGKEIEEKHIEKPIEELAKEVSGEHIEERIEELIKEISEEYIEESLEGLTKEILEEHVEKPTEELTKEIEEEHVKKPIEEVAEDLIDNEKEESELIEKTSEESVEESKEKKKRIIIGIIISFFTILAVYFGMAKYFASHFYFGSEINSINVSGKTVEEAKKVMADELQDYSLSLKERGDKSEQIKGDDINLKYNSDEELQGLKDSQNSYKWVLTIFNRKDLKMKVSFSCDERMLKERLDKLICFNSSNIVEPKNPSFRYVDNSYIIIDEVPGNKVDKNILYSQVVNSIQKGEREVDLESAGCYMKPQYNSKSQKIIEVKDTLNKYVSSKVTYIFGGKKETLDSSIINKWLIVDEDFKITLDKKKVRDYINTLSSTYDTAGKTRKFATSLGTTVNIGGGDYGSAINRDKETESLIRDIKEGKIITRKPIYTQMPLSYDNNDIGNTYIEISIAEQHIWFYKNGSLVVQGDVVTGSVSGNHSTPKGIYTLKYKQRNTVLKGADYAAPVAFWMPFNGGIGIHDASWRGMFGGNIYWTNGSHGCVNAPYSVASVIFNNIEAGTPVVCY